MKLKVTVTHSFSEYTYKGRVWLVDLTEIKHLRDEDYTPLYVRNDDRAIISGIYERVERIREQLQIT